MTRTPMTMPPQAASMQSSHRQSLRVMLWLSGALLLAIFQVLSGTDPVYTFLVFLFVVMTGLTLEALGGIATLTGLCVAVLAFQHVIISQIAKVVFWQPADQALLQPVSTIGVYLASMTGIFLAALVTRRLVPLTKKPIFVPEVMPAKLYRLALVMIVLETVQWLVLAIFGTDTSTGQTNVGGVFGPLRAMGYWAPLAVASSTAYIIITSKGKRSVGWMNGVAMLIPFLAGLIGAGRAGMSQSIVTYVITCLAFRFRFRAVHIVTLLACAYIAQYILFPYALYARAVVRTPDFGANVSKAVEVLEDIVANPETYQELLEKSASQASSAERRLQYYGHSLPTLDRYSIIITGDAIVDATVNHGTTGMETIAPGFQACLPRFLAPDKPLSGSYAGNLLAHRASGLVDPHDDTTGITLGFSVDAFSSYGWVGAIVIPFMLAICTFVPYRLIIGDRLYRNVSTISFAFILPWGFSESSIGMQIPSIIDGGLVLIITYAFILFLTRIIAFINEATARKPRDNFGYLNQLPPRNRIETS